MIIDRLLLSFKHIDRILNQNTYHKEIISYRNYPEINTKEKTIQDEDQSKRFAFKALGRSAINRDNIKEEEEKEEQKEQQAINFLFKYSCDMTQNRTVSAADWNTVNKDLLAVSYGEYDLNSNREGYVMFWTLKNPSFPERIIKYPSSTIALNFSHGKFLFFKESLPANFRKATPTFWPWVQSMGWLRFMTYGRITTRY